jgi:hypothetical protein
MKIWEPKPTGTLWATSGLLRDCFTFTFNISFRIFLFYGRKTLGHPNHTAGTVMRRLTTGILSEKCVFRRFRRRANVADRTYSNLDSIAYYTPRLYDIAYCS